MKITNSVLGFHCLKKLSILVILIIFCLAFPIQVNAAEQILTTLTVTGEGKENIATTLTNIQLGIELQGKTATEVQQKLAKQTSALVEFLRSRNVEQLQTTGIQLRPEYNYDNSARRLIGYIGVNTLSFRLPTEKVGNIIDQAVNVGATRIDNISFTADDETIANAQKQALRQAVQSAQAQADAVLQALNLTSKAIVSIQINGANVPQPQFIQLEAMSERSQPAFSTPVIGGEQSVTASVTLQISY